jgi:hypothetical protein
LGDKTFREATKGSVAAMTDPETEFTDLLNFLIENGTPRNYLADLPRYRKNYPQNDSLNQTTIKIMESGIFTKGD